jgi:hypothetical protein
MQINTLIYCSELIRRDSAMKYHMDRQLRFWVKAEYKSTKHLYPNLKRAEIIAGILSQLESTGHANRYIRKDRKLGWRATDEMREDLFKQEQNAIYDQLD